MEGQVFERHLKSARVKLRPLSKERLPDAIAAAQRIFTEPADTKAIARDYEMSLNPEMHQEELAENGFNSLKYWFVNKTKKSGEIVGITGLETRLGDPEDMAWLGWFGVVPEARGKGFGRAILKKTIAKARSIGFERLRLWTTAAPSEIAAQDMYEDFDFRLIEDGDVLTREKFL